MSFAVAINFFVIKFFCGKPPLWLKKAAFRKKCNPCKKPLPFCSVPLAERIFMNTLDSTKNKIESAILAAANEYRSSGAVSVMQSGTPVCRFAFGEDSVNSRFMCTLECDFFLSVMVLLLVRQKKLSLSDKLSRFIPEYKHADKITIRNLLDAKSGIRSFFYGEILRRLNESGSDLSDEERRIRDTELSMQYYSLDKVLELVGDKELEFTPDTDKNFTSNEAVFIRTVIERACGRSLWSFAKENIFAPLKMNDVSYGCDGLSHRVLFRNEKILNIKPDSHNPYIFTLSLSDAEKLASAVFGGTLLTKKELALAASFKDDNNHWGFCQNDGFISCVLGFYGADSTGVLYYDLATGITVALLSSKEDAYIEDGGSYRFFRKSLRTILAEEFTVPKNTKMVPYNKHNFMAAMNLEVTKEQLDFVDDAKTTIAEYAACPAKNKLFVEEESGRAVGLLLLHIDKKKGIYEISIVLIDKRYQHRGFGKFMLEFAVDYLKNVGAKRLDIGVNRFNLPAQHLYRSVGFKENCVFPEGMLMYREL